MGCVLHMGLQMGDAKGVYIPIFGIVPWTDTGLQLCPLYLPMLSPTILGGILECAFCQGGSVPISPLCPPYLYLAYLYYTWHPPSYRQLWRGGYCPPLIPCWMLIMSKSSLRIQIFLKKIKKYQNFSLFFWKCVYKNWN